MKLIAVIAFICLSALAAGAKTYYVDAGRGDDANSGASATEAWRSLDRANAALLPGDTCLIRGGVYADSQIAPARSGDPGAPITYAAYQGERPEITGGRSGSIVFLHDRTYVVVKGLRIHSPAEPDWVVRITGEQARHNRIEGCDISDPQGYAPVVIALGASYNTVTDCTVHDTGHGEEGSGDCIVLNEGAHHNTVTRNRCYNGCHSQVLLLNGSRYNVIADNDLYATDPAWSGAGVNLVLGSDANVVTGNHIHHLGRITHEKCAIQVDTADNLIQHNLIHDVGAFGISLQSYAYKGQRQEAVRNLVANNTVTSCGRQPLSFISKADCVSRDNRIVANIFTGAAEGWYDSPAWIMLFDTYHLTQPATPGAWFGSIFASNVFFHARAGEKGMVLYSHRGGVATWSVPELAQAYPETFRDTIEADPQFANPAGGDFHLGPTSPLAGGGLGAQ
jgi:hypothetical protein